MYLARADGIGGEWGNQGGVTRHFARRLDLCTHHCKTRWHVDYPRVQTQLLVLQLALVRNMSEESVEHCAIIVSSTLSNSVTECEREVLSLLTAKPRLNYSEINLII